MIGTMCVAEGCPVKENCERYVAQRSRKIRWFMNPPAESYEPDGCKEMVPIEKEFVFPKDLPDKPIQEGCVVSTNEDNQECITCLKCKKTSYHPKDIEHLFCGYCNNFHAAKYEG